MQNQKHQKRNLLNRIFEGDTVLCVASGTSLDTDDIAYAKDKCRVIVINDNYKIAPWADMLYACDLKWWVWHEGVQAFEGIKYTQDEKASKKFGLNYIKGTTGIGLSDSPEQIHTGSNSGFQAINLAYLLGAKRILLTGYDMKIGDDGASHWFGDHPDQVRSYYDRWLPMFDQVAKQNFIEIINCTRDTALKCFPRMTIQEALGNA